MHDKKLMVINFQMDSASPVLGWQGHVVRGLAKRFRSVSVLTHLVGKVALPPNCELKTFPRFPQRRMIRSIGGLKCIAAWVALHYRRSRPDVCFIHMNFMWANHLRSFFRRNNIPVLMWYAHGSVTTELQRALDAVDRVVTSTPEGFRIESDKIRFIGQAIDTEVFRPIGMKDRSHEIIYVGRISPRKRIDRMIQVFADLVAMAAGAPLKLRLIGPALTSIDDKYQQDLRRTVHELGLENHVEFMGSLTAEEIASWHSRAFVHLNLSETGSMDKTVMESLACGCPVLTHGTAFRALLANTPEMLVDENADSRTIAHRLLSLYRNGHPLSPDYIRSLVAGKHDLNHYLDELERNLLEICL